MKFANKHSIAIATTAVLAALAQTALAQKPGKPNSASKPPARELIEPDPNKGIKPPSGPSFYVAPIESSKGMFSLLLGNGNLTVAGSFTQNQLEIFEAVLSAAKDFAQTDEAAGKSAPIITRLMDQHEWSLFVDVSKMGDRSKFYVTLITPVGKLTAEAGEILRDSKKEQSALLFTMLSQIQSATANARQRH